ncbi:MAG: response regulator [bacterium]|nr:response regulator [bacterium]
MSTKGNRKKIRFKLLPKIIITFLTVMIIPIILVIYYFDSLITINTNKIIIEKLNYGKELILNQINKNEITFNANSIRIVEDERILKFISKEKRDKEDILELLSEYDMSYINIYDSNLAEVFTIKFNHFNKEYIPVDIEMLEKGLTSTYCRIKIIPDGFLLQSVSPVRDFYRKDISTSQITHVALKGVIINKSFVHDFKNVTKQEYSLVDPENFTYILTTITDPYGENIGGSKIYDEVVVSAIEKLFSNESLDSIIIETSIDNIPYKTLFFKIENDRRIFSGIINQPLDIPEGDKTKSYLLIIFGIFLFLIIIASFFITKNIVIPLKFLLNGIAKLTHQIKDKKPFKKITMKSSDEIYDLSISFNTMGEQLKSNFDRINLLQEYLSKIIESMPSILISIKENGIIVQWNTAAAKQTGIPISEAINKNIWDILPLIEEIKSFFLYSIEKSETTELNCKKVFTDKENLYNVTIFPLYINGAIDFVLRLDDVTELEKKELQLRQAQKMETIGNLAGGLAHDFNNALGGIIGTLSIMKFHINKGRRFENKKLKDYINTMEYSGIRATDMVQQLLTLSSKQETSFAPVDLNSSIKHVIKICSNTFDKCIKLDTVYFVEPAIINADPTQIEQVLLNLCVNASHAMTLMKNENEVRGGTLTISIEKTISDKSFCKTYNEAKTGTYFKLSVIDNGVGIEPENIAKIFDPFFTTKEKGKGTGLGMSMVFNILKQHKGFIDVYSEIGVGTTMYIFLPVIDKKDYVKENKSLEKYCKGSGTILIIDDEKIIRDLAGSILMECGYQVIFATDGNEGVKIYREKNEEITAILMDMVMPNKSGYDAYIDLKTINPEVKVVLTSGYAYNERINRILNTGVQKFIQKPFTLEKLSKIMYELINS